MDTLIAEDLLLLLLDDETGRTTGHVARYGPMLTGASLAPVVLGGGVLVELALMGAVHMDQQPEDRDPRLHAVPRASVSDPVLVRGLEELERYGTTSRLDADLPGLLGQRLVERGVLERRDSKVLGLIRRTRWPTVDSRHEDELRRELTRVLVDGGEPAPRTAALVAVLDATRLADRAVDRGTTSAREVRSRATAVTERPWPWSWAAQAVHRQFRSVVKPPA